MDSREAYIALNMVEGIGAVRARMLIEHFGDAPNMAFDKSTDDVFLAADAIFLRVTADSEVSNVSLFHIETWMRVPKQPGN